MKKIIFLIAMKLRAERLQASLSYKWQEKAEQLKATALIAEKVSAAEPALIHR